MKTLLHSFSAAAATKATATRQPLYLVRFNPVSEWIIQCSFDRRRYSKLLYGCCVASSNQSKLGRRRLWQSGCIVRRAAWYQSVRGPAAQVRMRHGRVSCGEWRREETAWDLSAFGRLLSFDLPLSLPLRAQKYYINSSFSFPRWLSCARCW